MDEFELIRRYFDRDQPGVDVGIGDDAAVVSVPPGQQLVVAVDTLVAGTHFPDMLAPGDIGYRAVAVNLSDMAAMGASPRWATLALTLPEADPDWLQSFAAGLFEACTGAGVSLIGGDTTRGPLTVSVQLLGLVATGAALRRNGARRGDAIAVTGTPGDAACGLRMMLGELECDAARREELVTRFRRPTARLQAGADLVGVATACIDVSDGLLADLGHICEESGVGAVLDANRLPLSPALRSCAGESLAQHLALTGGDDYELCFTIDEARLAALTVPAAVIGRIEGGAGVRVEGLRAPLPEGAPGYRHFSSLGAG